ncbi:MAG: hypothetical protein B7X56_05835 [Burkholderiales bacterium 34-67-9]|nr:MAG: hypothetical protein B7X56_05835 [Burkholderiales bacterium 34-67-9]
MSGSIPGLTITSANSVYMLAINLLFPAPQQLQGFAADAAFDTEAGDVGETVMGVDGRMSAGYVPVIYRQTISIMPDSASATLFENWITAQKAVQEVFYATATIALPSVQRKYTLSNGILVRFPPIAPAKKVLERRDFVIAWGSIDPAVF